MALLDSNIVEQLKGYFDKINANIELAAFLDDSEKSTLRDNLNVYDKTSVDTKLNSKANIDGSNIDKAKFTENLIKDANISTPTNTIVTDKLVKDYLDNNYTNNTILTSKLDTKVNKDLSNLNDTEKSTLRDNLNVYDKTNIDNKLNEKANKSDLVSYLKLDGSNLTNDNRSGLITKLTDGANAINPIGALVTDSLLKTTVQDTLAKGIGAIEKGDITSKTLTVTGGEDKVFGKDVSVELKETSIETKHIKDGSVTEEKLSKDVKDRLNNSVDKTNPEDIANLYFKISELNRRLAHSPASNDTNTFITNDILHNIEDPIFDKDVANKRYVDNSISKVSEELAVTNAMAAIPQVSGNKLLSLGAGVAHIGNKQAIALGLSGQTSNQLMVYKASAGIGLSGKWGVQAGVAFNLFNDEIAKDVKNIKTNGSKDDKLREEITDMISKLSSENLELMKQLGKVSQENENIKQQLNNGEVLAKQVVDNARNIQGIQEDLLNLSPSKKSIELFGFKVNEVILSNKQIEALTEIAKVSKKVEIIGYADSKGNDKYNLQLGLDRAREVAKVLAQQLVASKAKSDGISFINRNKSKNEPNNSRNSSENDSNNNSNINYRNGRNEELDRLLNNGNTNNNRIETLNKNRLTKYETIYEVKQGSVIPAILITEVNTDLPGSVLAQVRENVYDTRSGKFLLIPKGSKLYGRYESSVARGQSRVFLVWDKLILPNSKTVDLSTFNTADSLGNSGVTDKVNNHTLALIGNAILSSVLNLGDTLSSGVSFSVGGINVGLNGNKKDGNDKDGSPFKQVTSKIVDQEANRKPTLTIKRGFKFNIIVNGDMILDKYKY